MGPSQAFLQDGYVEKHKYHERSILILAADYFPGRPRHLDFDWAHFFTVDLGLIQGKEFEEIPLSLVERVGKAFNEDGFVYAINHGLSAEAVRRQFSIGQYAFHGVSEQQQEAFAGDIVRTGSFEGYKRPGHWKIAGIGDQIRQLNLVSRTFSSQGKTLPPELQALYPEMEQFARYVHDVIAHKVFNLLSLALKLPADTLWKLHKDALEDGKGNELFRYASYRAPPKEDDQALSNVRLAGHSDFNSISILFSQPITSLEVLMPDGQWKLARHVDNGLVINLGDTMYFLSGGYLKQTIHRVIAPPEDQAQYERLGVFYFSFPENDVVLEPIAASTVAQENYHQHHPNGFWGGAKTPTASEWQALRVSRFGQVGSQSRQDGHIEGNKVFKGNEEINLWAHQPPKQSLTKA